MIRFIIPESFRRYENVSSKDAASNAIDRFREIREIIQSLGDILPSKISNHTDVSGRKDVLDDLLDRILEIIFGDRSLEFDFCLNWNGFLGAGLPIPIKTSQKLALAGIVVDTVIFICFLFYGFGQAC